MILIRPIDPRVPYRSGPKVGRITSVWLWDLNQSDRSWKGGTWSELNRTKVYSISKKLNSAKVGDPLYLNNSHVVRAKPLHCGSNALIYALSMTRIAVPCSYYFFYTPQHTLNQVDQRFLSDFPPDLMQSFSQLRFDGFRR